MTWLLPSYFKESIVLSPTLQPKYLNFSVTGSKMTAPIATPELSAAASVKMKTGEALLFKRILVGLAEAQCAPRAAMAAQSCAEPLLSVVAKARRTLGRVRAPERPLVCVSDN